MKKKKKNHENLHTFITTTREDLDYFNLKPIKILRNSAH